MSKDWPIVYDVGMNNGDDCEYYLKKGYRVIAIEANPQLCHLAAGRFKQEIDAKHLLILNIGVGLHPGRLPFFIHKVNSVLSTFVPFSSRIGFTATLKEDEFRVEQVEVKRLSDIVRFMGPPDYIKIDVEGFDVICLRDLDRQQIYPRYLSAEAHSIDTFCHLTVMGYTEFKLVAGNRVAMDFSSCAIQLVSGAQSTFSFKEHSAGPFGEDIPGEWMTKEQVLEKWFKRGGGWFDLHGRMTQDTHIGGYLNS